MIYSVKKLLQPALVKKTDERIRIEFLLGPVLFPVFLLSSTRPPESTCEIDTCYMSSSVTNSSDDFTNLEFRIYKKF